MAELEPQLRDSQPGRRLFDGASPAQAGMAAISAEQQAYADAIGRGIAKGIGPDFSDQIVNALAIREAWEEFSLVVGDSVQLGMVQFTDRFTGPGSWKIAGVLALGRPGNSADLLVTLGQLKSGFDLRFTAKRTDPAELALNLPMPLDRSFSIAIAAGVAGDAVEIVFRLERYGVR